MKSVVLSVLAMLIAGTGAVPLGPGLGKPASAPIPMKETSEFGDVWTKAAARMPDDHKAWKRINNVLEIKAGTLHPPKEERLAGAYSLARCGKDPGVQGLAADALLEADIPEVTRDLLLHPTQGVAGFACLHLL